MKKKLNFSTYKKHYQKFKILEITKRRMRNMKLLKKENMDQNLTLTRTIIMKADTGRSFFTRVEKAKLMMTITLEMKKRMIMIKSMIIIAIL
jgi:hypothetical protein